MRYIRCARNQREQNMHMVQYGPNIYYRSFKEINPGEELLVWYENQYEQHFGIPMYIKLSSFAMPSNGRGKNQGEVHIRMLYVVYVILVLLHGPCTLNHIHQDDNSIQQIVSCKYPLYKWLEHLTGD